MAGFTLPLPVMSWTATATMATVAMVRSWLGITAILGPKGRKAGKANASRTTMQVGSVDGNA
jgi:hypothetical protein